MAGPGPQAREAAPDRLRQAAPTSAFLVGFGPALALNMNHYSAGKLWAFNLENYAGT